MSKSKKKNISYYKNNTNKIKKNNNQYYYKTNQNNKKGINIDEEQVQQQDYDKTTDINRDLIDTVIKEDLFTINDSDMSGLNNKLEEIANNSFKEKGDLEEPILIKKEKKQEDFASPKFKFKPKLGYILGPLFLIVILFGTAYAWFNYYQEDSRQADIEAGEVYVKLKEDPAPSLTITNAYPRTVSEARARNDNYVDFTILGKNTSETTAVLYSLVLSNGEDVSGKTRIAPQYLLIDLSLLDENNNETLIVDSVKYSEFNNLDLRAINNVPINTTEEMSKKYRLRMWVSDSVVISDTEQGATYTQAQFNNLYANVSLSTTTETTNRSLPLSVNANKSNVENAVSYIRTTVSNNYKLKDAGELLSSNDTIVYQVTNPDNLLYFQYVDSRGDEDTTNNESLDLTYIFNKNESVDVKVFTKSRTDSNVNTTIHFKVMKNGSVIKEYDQVVSVVGNNYCINNGFTKLVDCILVSENLSKSKSEAISYINSKGSPNVNVTAPTYEYVEQITENFTYTGVAGYPNWRFSDKYSFDTTSGTFTLKKADGVTNETDIAELSNAVVGKYTAGTNNNSYTNIGTIYQITSVDVANRTITGTKITYKQSGSMDSEVGLYKVRDDYGDTYIYRGNVKNNNVYFGGYYWKIIRINGSDATHDGSIRLIFNGKTLSANGNNTAGNNAAISATATTGVGATYPFNQSPGGPTYVGYMNTESANYWETSTLATYSSFAENTEYYFADDFETYTDAVGNRQFKLKKNNYLFKSKVKNLTAEQINATLYTCSGTSDNLICTRLVKVDSRVANSNTQVKGYYITYSPNYKDDPSLGKADTELNTHDSNAKRQLELWYRDKFMNNDNRGTNVTEYLVDSTFCNDRSIVNPYVNGSYNLPNSYTSGYLLTTLTYYAGRSRLIDASAGNKSATLQCANANDKFSTTATYGNAQLTYPVALITADEVALAGGKYNEKNENFYLRTSGSFWTMTPSHFNSTSASAYEFYVNPTGLMNLTSVTNGHGLRAVINLKSDTLIHEGYGTIEKPFIIE